MTRTTQAKDVDHIRLSVANLFPRYARAMLELCPSYALKYALNYGEEYWLEMDRKRGYPTEFVNELSQVGFLGVLMP